MWAFSLIACIRGSSLPRYSSSCFLFGVAKHSAQSAAVAFSRAHAPSVVVSPMSFSTRMSSGIAPASPSFSLLQSAIAMLDIPCVTTHNVGGRDSGHGRASKAALRSSTIQAIVLSMSLLMAGWFSSCPTSEASPNAAWRYAQDGLSGLGPIFVDSVKAKYPKASASPASNSCSRNAPLRANAVSVLMHHSRSDLTSGPYVLLWSTASVIDAMSKGSSPELISCLSELVEQKPEKVLSILATPVRSLGAVLESESTPCAVRSNPLSAAAAEFLGQRQSCPIVSQC